MKIVKIAISLIIVSLVYLSIGPLSAQSVMKEAAPVLVQETFDISKVQPEMVSQPQAVTTAPVTTRDPHRLRTKKQTRPRAVTEVAVETVDISNAQPEKQTQARVGESRYTIIPYIDLERVQLELAIAAELLRMALKNKQAPGIDELTTTVRKDLVVKANRLLLQELMREHWDAIDSNQGLKMIVEKYKTEFDLK